MIINTRTLNYYIVSSCKSFLRTDHDFCCFMSVIFISKRYCHKDCLLWSLQQVSRREIR
jgi:hypothetical protein